jgi:hypothetical protein
MVMQLSVSRKKSQAGVLMTEMVVAMAILVVAIVPLAFIYPQEQKLLRSSYQRAVAMEIVDGEMEVLLAGEWRSFKEGTQTYPFHAESAKNLPPGRAELTVTKKHLRLDWMPEQKSSGGEIVREADLK